VSPGSLALSPIGCPPAKGIELDGSLLAAFTGPRRPRTPIERPAELFTATPGTALEQADFGNVDDVHVRVTRLAPELPRLDDQCQDGAASWSDGHCDAGPALVTGPKPSDRPAAALPGVDATATAVPERSRLSPVDGPCQRRSDSSPAPGHRKALR
jgi:hypothetical protein